MRFLNGEKSSECSSAKVQCISGGLPWTRAVNRFALDRVPELGFGWHLINLHGADKSRAQPGLALLGERLGSTLHLYFSLH